MLLATHLARSACERYALPPKQLSKQLSKILSAYGWPGNVRELGNVMEALVIEAGQDPVIYPKHLPGHIRMSYLDRGKPKRPTRKPAAPSREPGGIQPYADYKSMRDKAYFEHLMDVCESDIPRASQLSGLSVPSIYRHLGLAGIPTKRKG